MNGFLLNMINRHQGRVDKVQPRARSLFEPEAAPAVSVDNAFEGTANAMVKESRDTGFEQQPVFSKAPCVEKSIPENPPSAPLSFMFQQPAQADESFRTYEPYTLDRKQMDLMNEKIQSVLARLGGIPESKDPFNGVNGLQNQASSNTGNQTASHVVANEQTIVNGIEETLRRLKNQTGDVVEEPHEVQDHAHTLLANTVKTEADPLLTVPAHPGIKGQQPANPHNTAINPQAQTVSTPISNPVGSLQIPDWITVMQTNLNNRWREINAKSQAEPVINVTIGRVEVRAINTEQVKPSAAQGKPKGVLSLEDYLKQRGSKERT